MILPRSNKALQINPPSGNQALSVGGSDWLWAVTAVFVVEFVGPILLRYLSEDSRLTYTTACLLRLDLCGSV